MSRHVVVLNAGSSSIKFSVFEVNGDTYRPLANGLCELMAESRAAKVKNGQGEVIYQNTWTAEGNKGFHVEALERVLPVINGLEGGIKVDGVGHRIVHGGAIFDAPALITDETLAQIDGLTELAPLHQPAHVAGIEAARAAWAGVPQVGVFDTGFHRSHPWVSDTYGLPPEYYDMGIRRYGLHGSSYEYIASAMHEVDPSVANGRIIVCHLGNGSSMCAIKEGKSVYSTMGFTALPGLLMGTRCGELDPGVVLYLQQTKGMSVEQVSDLIYKKSGLKGMSTISHDMREVEASDKPEAKRALEYFVSRVCYEMGALASTIGGVDAVVFCGGIGENGKEIRAEILQKMSWIGIDFDAEANKARKQLISKPGSKVKAYVVPTNEEVQIAKHTIALIDGAAK